MALSSNLARSSDSNFFLSLLRDKTFQAREIRRVIFLSAIYLLVTTVLVGLFYHAILGKLIAGASPLFFVSEDMELFNEALPGMATVLGRWVIAMLVVNVIITMAIGTYILRKLGHPILAIKRALREIGEGDLNVRLRATDDKEFGEIADGLNSAMERIRTHVAEAKTEIANLTELKDSPAANASDINEALENCHAALSYFNVEQRTADDSDASEATAQG